MAARRAGTPCMGLLLLHPAIQPARSTRAAACSCTSVLRVRTLYLDSRQPASKQAHREAFFLIRTLLGKVFHSKQTKKGNFAIRDPFGQSTFAKRGFQPNFLQNADFSNYLFQMLLSLLNIMRMWLSLLQLMRSADFRWNLVEIQRSSYAIRGFQQQTFPQARVVRCDRARHRHLPLGRKCRSITPTARPARGMASDGAHRPSSAHRVPERL
eukprot:COSAG01_NODE_7569_length_3144_cov_12.868966_2_plen_212_part_00